MSTEEATADDAPAPAETSRPTPVLEGSFAVFTPPNGNVVVAWKKRGTPETRHLVIPSFIMQMAAQASGGETSDIISAIASGNL